jgi:hypothetical protein
MIMATFSTYAAWFGVLLNGRVHPRSHDNIVKGYRYQWRLNTFLMCWRNEAPAAPTTGAIDPGDDFARLSIAYGGEGLNRFGPIIKLFTTIPWQIKVFFMMIGAYIAMVIGTINVFLKGEFPQAQRDTVVKAWREAMQLASYLLLTDVDPRG